MKNKFNIVIAFIIICIYFFNINVANAAASGIVPKLVFNKNIYLPGDKVTMSLRLVGTRTSDKTNSVSFDIEYDGNSFELETGSVERDVKDGYIKFTTKFDVGTGLNKKISLMHVNMSKDTFLKDGSDVFTINFKVKRNATLGAKLFKLLPVKMLDMTFNTYKVNNGQAYCNSIEIGSSSHIKMIINGQIVNFDVSPQIINGRVLVPFRKIFETLGATVDWKPTSQTVIGTKGDTEVALRINRNDAMVNNMAKKLHVAPIIKNGRTLVPARFISESLGANVDWDGDTRTVVIAIK